MKIAIAINASPRKNGSTALLLQEALRGAAEAGAETELIHLIDLDFKGCVSCFACKRLGNPNYGKCNLKDDLTPVLERLAEADVLLIGSPIYVGNVTGMARNFIERQLFPYITYSKENPSCWKGKLSCAYIFTQNCPADRSAMYESMYAANASNLRFFGGKVETLVAANTWQFDDYGKYSSSMFDVEEKRRIRDEEFPKTLAEAFELGRRLTE